MADEISYHVLSHPYPEDFVAWYPYIKPEVMRGAEAWLPWLERVIAGDTLGLNDRFVAARDSAGGRWLGVVWASVSGTAPEIAHFGWFYTEESARGTGVGGRIIDTYLSTLSAEGVRAVMLPTQLANQRAIGMYYRRGWQLSITDPAGGVWMVREPAGFYESYFTPEPGRMLLAGAAAPADYVALDYLLSRPAAPIRLLPLGLVGNRRFMAFCHDWEGGHYVVARQEGQPMALAVFRDMRQTRLDNRARRLAGNIIPSQDYFSGLGRAQSSQRLDQLGLPVALHAGDAQDLTRPHRK